MFQVEETSDAECFVKAQKRGQKTFTVVERDIAAVRTIAHWMYLNIEQAPDHKLREALESCLAMRRYPKRKIPD